MKYLVIVESPSKCKKIEKYLNDNDANIYEVVATMGHITEVKSLKNIDMTNFQCRYDLIDAKMKHIDMIRKKIQCVDEVILACDADREGEGICYFICHVFQLDVEKTKRIVFHEITESAIIQAIRNPRSIDMNLAYAQQSRQILDLLVGFSITPLLWDCFSKNHQSSLSAGRCQTPALRLVYDNYLEIKNQSREQHYQVTGYFTSKIIPFELSKTFDTEDELMDFFENTLEFQHIYSCSEPKESIVSQPDPFITSTLQQAASNELHMSPKETMKHAQQLYEVGLITYMRTDSKTYSKEFIETVKKYILQNYNDSKYIHPNVDNLCESNNKTKINSDNDKANDDTSKKKTTKKKEKTTKEKEEKTTKDEKENLLSQEAHEAIRPVNIQTKLTDIKEQIDPKAKKLYELIWKRTLESCMSEAIYYFIVAEISAYKNTVYKYRTDQILFPGWKILQKKYDENNSLYHYLLHLKQKVFINYHKITAKVHIKNMKHHYTEARLVQLLEEKGIGRPSTFSSLIDKIQERGYVNKENVDGLTIKCREFSLEGEELTETMEEREFGNEKGKLVIKPLGILVIEFLIKHFEELFNYEYTKQMEDDLDMISQGKMEYGSLCRNIYEQLNKLMEPIQKEKRKIQIDEHHEYMIGKYGPVIKHTIDNNVEFLPVKKDIDFKKLEAGEYTLPDLLDDATDTSKKILLGKYQGLDLFVKKGKYGNYVEWGENKQSIGELATKPIHTIDYIDVLKFLERDGLLDPTKPVGLVRELSNNISIRSGKFGNYIYYKNTRMKKPQFFPLKNFKEDVKTCSKHVLLAWIKEVHKIE
jgi:DNA topoisomerase-1